jgi:two-component system LytT family response regulator
MRTPWDGYGNDDALQPRDPRYPLDVGPDLLAGARRPLSRIAVKSVNRIVIVQVTDIVRIEAEDNYVRLWADRPYLHKETLSGLMTRLDPAVFLRVHRSHAVNISAVRELRPLLHGEYLIILGNGTEITSGRSYRAPIQDAFGLGRAANATP